jgi:hypothetical protein
VVAAAVIGAGVAGAAGSAIAGSEAAGATKSAAQTAAAEQNAALSQQAALSAPYRALGQSAITPLQSLLGIGGTAQQQQQAQAALAATPGYQFTLQQGLDAAKSSAAAGGMLNSGNTLQALTQYGTGLADQTYQQAVGNLENVVNTGQAAAAGQAANVGNAATNLSNIAMNQGTNLANIDANTIAGITRAGGNTANNLLTLQALGNPGGGANLGVADPVATGQLSYMADPTPLPM